MNVSVPYPAMSDGSAPGNTMIVPLGLMAVYWCILFAFLYTILTREDFDAPNKILWVIVVALVPVLGFILYVVAAPAAPKKKQRRMVAGNRSLQRPVVPR